MNDYAELHRTVTEEFGNWHREFDAIDRVEKTIRKDRTSAIPSNHLNPVLVPMVESAMASMVPPDLKVTITKNKGSEILFAPDEDERWLAKISKSGNWISEFRRAVIHSLIAGRSVFHVGMFTPMGEDEAVPAIKCVGYDEVFWPAATARQSELPWVARIYKVDKKTLISAYPNRKSDLEHMAKQIKILDVTHIEDRCRVVMLADKQDMKPLMVGKGKDYWNPWVISPLINNGIDLLGLSPFRVGLKLALRVSRLYERLAFIGDKQVPTFMLDSSQVGDVADLAKVQKAEAGSFILVKFNESNTNRPFAQATPSPAIPPQLFELLNVMSNALAYLTGISSTSRGQTVGAKTATEMALIDASTRGLTAMRQQALYDGFVRAAARALALYKDKTKSSDIEDFAEFLTVTAASASELNRMVISEKFNTIYPALKDNPAFDQSKLNEFLVRVFELPDDILAAQQASPATVDPKIQAALQAAQATGLPGMGAPVDGQQVAAPPMPDGSMPA